MPDWKELKTKEEILQKLKGKAIKDIEYEEGYGDIRIIFSDETCVDIIAEDCFNFRVGVKV